ncbi:MAG: histidine kinase [Elusimicrobia bacterium RIFOXYB2_FULL_49_7]|nr:MAG: histidine kinase [Elusimicrobia bacterium RIFOXYB2_FULL_49_7]
MTILSVDDSGMIRKVIRRIVESMGHELLEAEDGEAALTVLREHGAKIRLVLLDWNMPKLDGYSVLTRMKGDPALKAIPVIMVTTEVDKTRIVQAVQAGARNYVMKPFSQEDLMAKITDSLKI